jgi:ArsR family transcriptional regulator, cadmium/lead-responsive transcriptional repressor
MPVAPASRAETGAALFRGLSDPTRLAILLELLDGERRVMDLVAAVGGSQSNVSGHLACLKDCGLVADRPEGRQAFYRIASKEVVGMLRAADKVLLANGHSIAICPRYGVGR